MIKVDVFTFGDNLRRLVFLEVLEKTEFVKEFVKELVEFSRNQYGKEKSISELPLIDFMVGEIDFALQFHQLKDNRLRKMVHENLLICGCIYYSSIPIPSENTIVDFHLFVNRLEETILQSLIGENLLSQKIFNLYKNSDFQSKIRLSELEKRIRIEIERINELIDYAEAKEKLTKVQKWELEDLLKILGLLLVFTE